MAKLTYHTSFQDLKESYPTMSPRQSDLKNDSELKDLVALLIKHRNYKNHTRINNSTNKFINDNVFHGKVKTDKK